jgi:hypothetical protein
MESGYPADACGAICLSFRALGKLSSKICPTDLEMNLIIFLLPGSKHLEIWYRPGQPCQGPFQKAYV